MTALVCGLGWRPQLVRAGGALILHAAVQISLLSFDGFAVMRRVFLWSPDMVDFVVGAAGTVIAYGMPTSPGLLNI